MIRTESFSRLIAAFRTLPGVGNKTAQRYAYKIIDGTTQDAERFAKAVLDGKKNIRFCPVCGDYTEGGTCELCRTRDAKQICVVAHPKDIDPIEKTGAYRGAYHVLHGLIDLQKGIDVDKIRIAELVKRVADGGTEEVIIATNPSVGGELTSAYIAGALKPFGIKVSRLAYGISVGSEIEYADANTLLCAIADRKPI